MLTGQDGTWPDTRQGWTVPGDIWHTDFPYDAPTDRVFGLLVMSYLADVPRGAGGTVAVAGSHRLGKQFVETRPRENLKVMKQARKAFLASHPWLRALTSDKGGPGRVERFMQTEEVVAEVPALVTELTGQAGDAMLGHPWLLHAPAPHCGDRPRMMRVQRLRKNEIEIVSGVTSRRKTLRLHSQAGLLEKLSSLVC